MILLVVCLRMLSSFKMWPSSLVEISVKVGSECRKVVVRI